MKRLTKKVGDNYCSQRGDFYDLYNKLGKIEDLLEKYLIASLEDLETALKIYYELLHINLDYDENGKLVVKKEV